MSGRAFAIGIASILTAWSSNGYPAQTAVGPTGTAGLPSASATCVMRGVAGPKANANIQDSQGRVIARFSGAPTALVATDFPSDAHGRVRVETGTGAGGFRVRGYLAVGDLPLFTAVNVPVIAGHVWIASGRDVSFVSSAPGRLRIEKRLTAPLEQTFTTWAPCNMLALAATPSTIAPSRSDARAYVFKGTNLAVYDQPSGALLTTLHRAHDSDGILFFSEERRADWISVRHHGDVVLDVWARARDLLALPEGDGRDGVTQRAAAHGPARLAIQGEPRVVKPVREVTLRASAKESDAPIGVIEPGAETYVLDVVAGWASVMPKALNVVPSSDGQFWVRASDLGI